MASLLHLVLLDLTSFDATFPTDSTESTEDAEWNSDVSNWSESSYRKAVAFYRSIILSNFLNPAAELPDDTSEHEENERVAKLLDLILGHVWDLDQKKTLPAEHRTAARKIVQAACLDVHDLIHQCKEHMVAWHKRESSLALRKLGDMSPAALFNPPSTRDNMRVEPWELSTAVHTVLGASLLQLAALIKDSLDGDATEFTKLLVQLDGSAKRGKDKEYEQIG